MALAVWCTPSSRTYKLSEGQGEMNLKTIKQTSTEAERGSQKKDLKMRNVTEYIFASPWIVGGEGMYPFRVVAYERELSPIHPDQDRKYVTHLEVDPREDGQGIYRVSGDYDLTHEEAMENAIKRYNQELCRLVRWPFI